MRAVIAISVALFALLPCIGSQPGAAAGEAGQKGCCCEDQKCGGTRHRFCDRAPLPPDAPILDSVAVRRVAIPQATRYRIEQTAGDLEATAAASCGSDKLSAAIKTLESENRLQEFESRFERMDQQLNRLLELIRAQQKIIDELANRVGGETP